MNRAQVIERLKLGRMLEVEASVDSEGRRQFLEVRPQIDDQCAYMKTADFAVEPVISRMVANADVIIEFRVRLCILNPGWEKCPDDWDHFLHEQKWFDFHSLDELESGLSLGFGIGLDGLQLPGKTDSPM